jgi:hypothetical protein
MNFETAYQRALLCDLAYTDAATPIGPHHAIVGSLAGTEGKETVIAFRGTKTFKEWLLDSRALPVRSTIWPGLVHSGFSDGVHGLWTELLKLLPKPDEVEPRKLHFTGHSLGAAFAIGSAWRAAGIAGYDVQDLHLFAPPEFGNSDFHDAFNKRLGARTYTFCNHNDVVPVLPPWWWAGHLGSLCYFDAQGAWHEQFTDRNTWELTWQDHHIEHYVRVLGNAAAQELAAAA